MATYIKGITGYIPQIQPFNPNIGFREQVLSFSQDKYDANRNKLSQLYGSLLNSKLTREDNVKARDQFFDLIEGDIKKLSGMDLSKSYAVEQGSNLFNSLLDNDKIVYDMSWTKISDESRNINESYRKSSDEKISGKYWDGFDEYYSYKIKDFRDADSDDALSMSPVKNIENVNMTLDAGVFLSKNKLQIKRDDLSAPTTQYRQGVVDGKLVTQSRTLNDGGRYIVTTENGSQAYGTAQEMLLGAFGNNSKYKDFYNAQTYVAMKRWGELNKGRFKDDNEATASFIDNYAEELNNSLDNKLSEVSRKIKTTKYQLDRLSSSNLSDEEYQDSPLFRIYSNLQNTYSSLQETKNAYNESKGILGKLKTGMFANPSETMSAMMRVLSTMTMDRDIQRNAITFSDASSSISMKENSVWKFLTKMDFDREENAKERSNRLEVAKINHAGILDVLAAMNNKETPIPPDGGSNTPTAPTTDGKSTGEFVEPKVGDIGTIERGKQGSPISYTINGNTYMWDAPSRSYVYKTNDGSKHVISVNNQDGSILRVNEIKKKGGEIEYDGVDPKGKSKSMLSDEVSFMEQQTEDDPVVLPRVTIKSDNFNEDNQFYSDNFYGATIKNIGKSFLTKDESLMIKSRTANLSTEKRDFNSNNYIPVEKITSGLKKYLDEDDRLKVDVMNIKAGTLVLDGKRIKELEKEREESLVEPEIKMARAKGANIFLGNNKENINDSLKSDYTEYYNNKGQVLTQENNVLRQVKSLSKSYISNLKENGERDGSNQQIRSDVLDVIDNLGYAVENSSPTLKRDDDKGFFSFNGSLAGSKNKTYTSFLSELSELRKSIASGDSRVDYQRVSDLVNRGLELSNSNNVYRFYEDGIMRNSNGQDTEVMTLHPYNRSFYDNSANTRSKLYISNDLREQRNGWIKAMNLRMMKRLDSGNKDDRELASELRLIIDPRTGDNIRTSIRDIPTYVPDLGKKYAAEFSKEAQRYPEAMQSRDGLGTIQENAYILKNVNSSRYMSKLVSGYYGALLDAAESSNSVFLSNGRRSSLKDQQNDELVTTFENDIPEKKRFRGYNNPEQVSKFFNTFVDNSVYQYTYGGTDKGVYDMRKVYVQRVVGNDKNYFGMHIEFTKDQIADISKSYKDGKLDEMDAADLENIKKNGITMYIYKPDAKHSPLVTESKMTDMDKLMNEAGVFTIDAYRDVSNLKMVLSKNGGISVKGSLLTYDDKSGKMKWRNNYSKEFGIGIGADSAYQSILELLRETRNNNDK